MKTLGSHIQKIFNYEQGSTPWLAMTFSCLSTSIPLLWGYFQNDVLHAIFSALMGHFLFVCDHPGTLKQRLSISVIASVIFTLFFALGVMLKGHFITLMTLFAFLTYGYAILGSISIKIERIFLFALVNIVVAYYNPDITLHSFSNLVTLNLGAILTVMILITLSAYFFPNAGAAPVTAEKYSIRSSFKEFHLYGLSLAIIVSLSLLWGQYLDFSKTYWIVITVLVIMRADKKITIHRSIQRLVGTIVGVIIVDILLIQFHSIEFYIALATLSTFLTPWGISRNYWIGTVFVTLLVMALLSMPSFSEPDLQISLTRLIATFYSCVFCFACLGLYDLLKNISLKRELKNKLN